MTAYYLLKTEPSEYSFADLIRDKETVWDGVANPVALRNLWGMHAGDKLLIYETGSVKSVVGTATVSSAQASGPGGSAGSSGPAVKIKAAKPLTKAVPLAEIKTTRLFSDSPLVRQGRLSVVPLSEEQYRHLAGE